jgi:thymidylate synthase (FAD)
MKLVKQSFRFVRTPNGEDILRIIEEAGRICYKTEDKITENSARAFVKRALDMGHHSIIEHPIVSVIAVTDRGVTHEIVRHRLASYSQESTRYCNYSDDKFDKEITYILPVWFYDIKRIREKARTILLDEDEIIKLSAYFIWETSCEQIEKDYFSLLDRKQSAQQARDVLNNSLKTEIMMTYNMREWRHFFSLRCSPKAHPQMRHLTLMMLDKFKDMIPVLFDDLYELYKADIE